MSDADHIPFRRRLYVVGLVLLLYGLIWVTQVGVSTRTCDALCLSEAQDQIWMLESAVDNFQRHYGVPVTALGHTPEHTALLLSGVQSDVFGPEQARKRRNFVPELHRVDGVLQHKLGQGGNVGIEKRRVKTRHRLAIILQATPRAQAEALDTLFDGAHSPGNGAVRYKAADAQSPTVDLTYLAQYM